MPAYHQAASGKSEGQWVRCYATKQCKLQAMDEHLTDVTPTEVNTLNKAIVEKAGEEAHGTFATLKARSEYKKSPRGRKATPERIAAREVAAQATQEIRGRIGLETINSLGETASLLNSADYPSFDDRKKYMVMEAAVLETAARVESHIESDTLYIRRARLRSMKGAPSSPENYTKRLNMLTSMLDDITKGQEAEAIARAKASKRSVSKAKAAVAARQK